MLRKLAFTLALVAACSVAVSAQAAGPSKLTLSPSSYKVLFGHKLTLSGTLAGGKMGDRVAIMALPYDRSLAKRIAIVRTTAGGHFSFAAKPGMETTYQARSSTIDSPVITVGVSPSTSIRELSNGHVWTRVKAGHNFDRRFVKLQTMTSGAWHTVAQKRLSTASVAVFSTRLPTSTVRIAMSVNQAGAGYLATSSHALAYKAFGLTIDAANYKVLYGHKVMLSGQLMNGRAGQVISIVARPYGRSAPLMVASVKTGASGHWSVTVKPKIQTAYQARWASAQSSAQLTVGVRPLVSIRELGNGNVWAHVQASNPFAGKIVKLQQLTVGGAWLTVAQHPLDKKSVAVFATSLPTSSIRVAMSVNQAGVGLLGTMSHSLAYHTV
jgi:hypothetical protein